MLPLELTEEWKAALSAIEQRFSRMLMGWFVRRRGYDRTYAKMCGFLVGAGPAREAAKNALVLESIHFANPGTMWR